MKKLFFHSKTTPRVTVAGIIKDDQISFGVSRCSTKDQFFKKKGRHIAEGRATKTPFATFPAPEKELCQWFVNAATSIVKQIEHHPELI